MTTDEIQQRVIDLRRIYGTKGVSDLLNINPSMLTMSDEKAVRRVGSGVKRYWQSWMRRGGLTTDTKVVKVESERSKEIK
jgi:hypothetical protein